MSARPRLLGAVLVGGRSSRMGRPKWRLSVGGVPMVVRAADALSPHVAELVTVAPDGARRLTGRRALQDGGRGPLDGLAAVLTHASERGDAGAVVLACDLPLVPCTLIGSLVAAWRDEDVVAPVCQGRLQPLCALWSVSALAAVRESLAEDHRAIMATVARLHTRALLEREWRPAAGSDDALLNVNTRTDLTRARSLARRAG